MKHASPRAYAVGPYTVREDAGVPKGTDGLRVARVFSRSVAIFHGTLEEALTFAQKKLDDCAMTVRCPICKSRPGVPCYEQNPTGRRCERPHTAREDFYLRILASDAVRNIIEGSR